MNALILPCEPSNHVSHEDGAELDESPFSIAMIRLTFQRVGAEALKWNDTRCEWFG